MSRDALSCIRCDKALENVFDEVENQPGDGLAFTSAGHYGSTEFDPMDGSYIELNVCDKCLIELRNEGRVLYGRKSKRVLFEGTIVGFVKIYRELTPWRGDEEEGDLGDDAPLNVDREDLERPELLPEITWSHPPQMLLDLDERDA